MLMMHGGLRLGNRKGRPADAHDVLGCGWAIRKGGRLMLMMHGAAAGQWEREAS